MCSNEYFEQYEYFFLKVLRAPQVERRKTSTGVYTERIVPQTGQYTSVYFSLYKS